MPGIWQAAAAQAVGDAVGIGIQRLGANYDRNQQIKTQQAMQNMQIEGNEQLMDYQQKIAMENWQNTGYGAQMKQMQSAGLNPGLMYGLGGGGGQSMGSGGTPSVTGGQAGYESTTKGIGMQMGAQAEQLALMDAQKKNIDADTANKQAENPNIPKTGENIAADTYKKQTETASITQGIENQKAAKALTDAQANLTNTQAAVATETQDAAIQRIRSDANNAISQAHMAMNEAGISDATINDKIMILKQTAIGAMLHNILTKAQTANTQQGTKTSASQQNLNEQTLSKIVQDNMRQWDQMSQKNREIDIDQKFKEAEIDVANKALLLKGIGDIFEIGSSAMPGQKPNKIGFK